MTERTKQKRDFLIHAAFIAVIIGIIYIIFAYVLDLIFPFIVALILVTIIHPVIAFIQKNIKINQKIVSIAMMALLYLMAGGFIFLFTTQIFFLLRDLFSMFPTYYSSYIEPSLLQILQVSENILANFPPEWEVGLRSIQDSLMSGVQSLVGGISKQGIELVTSITNRIPTFLMNFIFTIMLSFFISVQYDLVVAFFKTQIPPKAQAFIIDLRILLKDSVLRYLRAYCILMCITFIELSIGLLILKTPNAILVAAGIALFDMLPIFGTGGIVIPWIIIELIKQNFAYALGLLVLYGIVTLVRNLIEPKIVGDQLGINPIISLMSIYLGFKLFGVFGMIFVPIAVQILLALHSSGKIRLYREKAGQGEMVAEATQENAGEPEKAGQQ